MQNSDEAYHWLCQGPLRQQLIKHLCQPMNTSQLARRLETTAGAAGHMVKDLKTYKLIVCLNPEARHSRLYWLSELGKECQKRLRELEGLPPFDCDLPDVDWSLYGALCYKHRSVILKTLDGPMQSAQIKRIAYRNDQTITMSANNCRDVVKLFLKLGVVQVVEVRGKAHKRFELTELGKQMQRILFAIEASKNFEADYFSDHLMAFG